MYVIAFNQISVLIALDGHAVSIYSTIMIPDINLLVEVRQVAISSALCVAIGYTDNLKVGMKAVIHSHSSTLAFYPNSCGRIMDSNLQIMVGSPIKNQVSETINLRGGAINLQDVSSTQKIVETGIKAIDFFTPYAEGGSIGIMGGAGTGKTILTMEIINNMRMKKVITIIAGVGERIREGEELYREFQESKLIDPNNPDESNIYIVFGTMDQPPALRERAALSSIAIAEFIRDKQGKPVLLIIDNIYRYTQAGSEISSSAREMPGESGYQPTLFHSTGCLQERIYSSVTRNSSLTSVQAIYVPQDDMTDQSVIALGQYMESVVVLDRGLSESGIYPSINPMGTWSSLLSPDIVGQKHFQVISKVRKVLNEFVRIKKIADLLGVEHLEGDNKIMYHRGRLIYMFISQPLITSGRFSNTSGYYVKIADTIRGFEMIVEGELDYIEPERLYMIGRIE